jgi:hypothetical protein
MPPPTAMRTCTAHKMMTGIVFLLQWRRENPARGNVFERCAFPLWNRARPTAPSRPHCRIVSQTGRFCTSAHAQGYSGCSYRNLAAAPRGRGVGGAGGGCHKTVREVRAGKSPRVGRSFSQRQGSATGTLRQRAKRASQGRLARRGSEKVAPVTRMRSAIPLISAMRCSDRLS